MRLLASCLAALALCSCASLQSVPDPGPQLQGLAYFMPKKDFLVTITLDSAKKVSDVKLDESPAYADLTRTYLLQYSRNAFGKNVMNVGVNEMGLLSSASSNTTSGLAEALKNLATSVGELHGGKYLRIVPPEICVPGANIFVLSAEIDGKTSHCGVHFTIKRFDSSPLPVDRPRAGSAVGGIYYRQEEPYLVKASGPGVGKEAILLSPSNAPVRLLPVFGTVFADNKTDFTFKDGMPTKYGVDTDGELIALFKLPADVISAYFAALGSVFDSFSSADTKKAAELDAQTKLLVAKQKYDACMAAVKANNPALVTSLGC